MYVRGYLQGSENGRVVTIALLLPRAQMTLLLPNAQMTGDFSYSVYIFFFTCSQTLEEYFVFLSFPIMSVTDEGYSRNAPCAQGWISMFLLTLLNFVLFL